VTAAVRIRKCPPPRPLWALVPDDLYRPGADVVAVPGGGWSGRLRSLADDS